MTDLVRAGIEQEMKAFAGCVALALVLVPLGIWKAVEIIVWLIRLAIA